MAICNWSDKASRAAYDRDRNNRNKDIIKRQKQLLRFKKRDWFIGYKKTLSCGYCNESRWYVLEFHHRSDREKLFDVANMITGGHGIDTIKKEIAKCLVLCSNCHRELHYLRNIVEEYYRGVAQSGRAGRLGRSSCKFKSCLPDHSIFFDIPEEHE